MDRKAIEQRRREGFRLLGKGESQAAVARILGVSRQTVSRWACSAETGGRERWKSRGRPGRQPPMDDAQLDQLAQMPKRGPEVFGYPTVLWTIERVRRLIGAEFGVSLCPIRGYGPCCARSWDGVVNAPQSGRGSGTKRPSCDAMEALRVAPSEEKGGPGRPHDRLRRRKRHLPAAQPPQDLGDQATDSGHLLQLQLCCSRSFLKNGLRPQTFWTCTDSGGRSSWPSNA